MAIKLRDALKQIGVNQDTGELRIKGSSIPADDDQKIITSAEVTVLQKYINNIAEWKDGYLRVGSASIDIGPQITISDAGNILSYYLKHKPNEHRVNPYYAFDEDGTIHRARVPRLIDPANITVDFHDGTTDHPAILDSGKYKLTATNVVSANTLLWQQTFRVGDTNPAEPVDITVYVGSKAVSNIGSSISLPVSFWSGTSPGDLITFYFASVYEGTKTPLATAAGETYYTEFSSNAPWSLYGDATQAFGRITGQLYQFDYLLMDNIVELTSTGVGTLTKDHVINATYYADTTLNPIDIKVYVDTLGSFQVNDAEMKFAINNCVVKIMNADGVTVDHTATLNFPNGSYDFIYNKDDSTWYYSEVGKGRWVAIASDHDADVDFPYEPQLPDIDLTATEANVGKVRYHTTDNSSCLDMCMQTGASTYAWVHVKENTW